MEDKILTIGGKEYILSPTFSNLKRMEMRLREKFMKTASRLATQNYGPEDIATIIFCLIDSDEKVNFDKLCDDVFLGGFNNYYVDVVSIFESIINAGSKDEGKETGNVK